MKKINLSFDASWLPRTVMAMLALTFSAQSSGQFGGAPSELELLTVHDDLFVIHSERSSGNIVVLIAEEGVLLVDDKWPQDFENIIDVIAGITDQPIRYVVNTHYHTDHSGSNTAMRAIGAELLASENARIKMADEGLVALPNITFEDHLKLYFGGNELDLYRFGQSHTDGDIVVHLPQRGTIVTGDIFGYIHNTGRIDYRGGGSARAYTRTLDSILELDFDTVIPGHDVVTDRAALVAFRDRIERMVDTVRELIRQQRSRAEIEAILRSEFGWVDRTVRRSLDGLLVELQ